MYLNLLSYLLIAPLWCCTDSYLKNRKNISKNGKTSVVLTGNALVNGKNILSLLSYFFSITRLLVQIFDLSIEL